MKSKSCTSYKQPLEVGGGGGELPNLYHFPSLDLLLVYMLLLSQYLNCRIARCWRKAWKWRTTWTTREYWGEGGYGRSGPCRAAWRSWPPSTERGSRGARAQRTKGWQGAKGRKGPRGKKGKKGEKGIMRTLPVWWWHQTFNCFSDHYSIYMGQYQDKCHFDREC